MTKAARDAIILLHIEKPPPRRKNMDALKILYIVLDCISGIGFSIALLALPIYTIVKIKQYLERQQEPDEKDDAELEFYRTATDLENNLRWDEEKRKMQKEQDLLRKSNEILIHLIQDEHRGEDR